MARRFPSTTPGTVAAAPGAVAGPTSLVKTPTVRSRAESAIKAALFLAAILSVVTTVLIVLSLLRETISFFGDVPIQDYLFGDKSGTTVSLFRSTRLSRRLRLSRQRLHCSA